MSSQDPFDMTRRVPEGGGDGDEGQPRKDSNGSPDEQLDRTVPANPSPPSQSAPEEAVGGDTIGDGSAGEPVSKGAGEEASPADAPPPPAKPSDPLIGVELGGCRIDSLLGRGAMGAVYRATQIRLNRQVAVKVMRPELLTDSRMLERFESEARVVAQFQSPHVVMVHDVGFEHGVHFLVMELVRGKNLRDYTRLLAGGRLPVAEAIPLLRQACKGLEEAQRQGIIHRDIKPDNLMLTDRGELKIADFGIAKPENDDLGLTMTQELIGTPLYMSPEQCQGSRDIDFRSDMYSLGATFYYLLTGEPPVRASSVYELIQTKTRLENLCLWKALPELDEHHPLSRVVARMTALSRDDRYVDYDDLATDLVLVQQGRTMEIKAPPKRRTAAPTGRKGAGKPPARKSAAGRAKVGGDRAGGVAASADAGGGVGGGRSWLIVVAVLVLLGGGGAGYWWWQNQQPKDDPSGEQNAGTQKPAGDPGSGGAKTGEDNGNSGASENGETQPPSIAAALNQHGASLAEDGPSAELRAAVVALEPPGNEVDARDALLTAIDQGLVARDALATIELPAAFELPFDDLAAHVQRVADAARVPPDPLAELRTWQESAIALVHSDCADLAADSLGVAFAKWQVARQGEATPGEPVPPAAELSDALRQQLSADLDAIAAGQSRAQGLLVSQRSKLIAALPAAELAAARAGLEVAPPPPVDFKAKLDECRKRFDRLGPVESIRTDTSELQPTARAEIEARRKLLDDWQAAATMLDSAKALVNSFPNDPVVPFKTDVEAYFDKIDLVLNAEGLPLEDWPEWVRSERRKLRRVALLQPKVIEACRAAWAAWQARKAAGRVAATDLESELQVLRDGLARARRLFPDAGAELAGIITEEQLTASAADLTRAQQLGSVLEGVRQTRAQLDAIKTLTDWRQAASRFTSELADHASHIAELGGDNAAASELQAARAVAASWRKIDERVRGIAMTFAAGDLAVAVQDARSRPSEPVGRASFEALANVVTGCRDVFVQLMSDLDGPVASRRLATFAAELDTLGERAAAARVRRWIGAVDRLAAAAAGLVMIRGGRTKHGAAGPFFLAPTEATAAEFDEFLTGATALVTAAGSGAAERRAALLERLGPATPATAEIVRVLRPRRPGRATMPVETVSGRQAWACAAWFGRSLPTRAEWALAAFGDGGEHRFPWGGQKYREPPLSLRAAGSGGESWRSPDGVTLRHLAGNVAEWLLPEAGATIGELAGGSYKDVPRDRRRRAAGDDYQRAPLDRALPGMGFRMVLRPRDVLAPEFARGEFPDLK
ncbi:MAG: bifunctional serine/threonine-protein kinase/formylglycine-generating enzyme family protein [bacterium]|nr:bifunctional serine/threonine-protein kinase/formylglycine-generating enzyme family protein [bacterium]